MSLMIYTGIWRYHRRLHFKAIVISKCKSATSAPCSPVGLCCENPFIWTQCCRCDGLSVLVPLTDGQWSRSELIAFNSTFCTLSKKWSGPDLSLLWNSARWDMRLCFGYCSLVKRRLLCRWSSVIQNDWRVALSKTSWFIQWSLNEAQNYSNAALLGILFNIMFLSMPFMQ